MLYLALVYSPYFLFKINTEEINGLSNNSLRHFSLDRNVLLAPPLYSWSVSCLSLLIALLLSEIFLIRRKLKFLEKLCMKEWSWKSKYVLLVLCYVLQYETNERLFC